MKKASTKRVHSFSLILSGVDTLDSLEAGIYGAGCDDALVGMRCGVAYVAFDRESESTLEAIASAIRDVRRMPSVQVVRVEPDDFVNMSEIAARIGQSRESVRKYVQAERGHGGFPLPVAGINARSMQWRWSEVAAWLVKEGKLAPPAADQAAAISGVNAALELNRVSPSKKELRRLLELAS